MIGELYPDRLKLAVACDCVMVAGDCVMVAGGRTHGRHAAFTRSVIHQEIHSSRNYFTYQYIFTLNRFRLVIHRKGYYGGTLVQADADPGSDFEQVCIA